MNNTETTYTFGAKFQKKILALLIRDRRFLIRHRDVVVPNYFENPLFIRLCNLVFKFYDNYKIPPSQASLEEYISDEKDVEAQLNLIDMLYKEDLTDGEYIVEEAVNFAKQQSMRRALAEMTALNKEHKFEELSRIFHKATLIGTDYEDLGMDYFESVEQRRHMLTKDVQHELRIATLIPEIDNVFGGGTYPGELNIMLAPQKVGKSIWLANMAAAAAWQGKKSVIISVEMSQEKIGYRLDTRFTGIPERELSFNWIQWQNKLNRIKKLQGKIWLKDFPSGTSSVLNIKNFLNKLILVKGFTPDMIIVDYLNEIRPEYSGKDSNAAYHALGQIARDLRGMAQEYGVHLWTAMQGTRSSVAKDVLDNTDQADSFKPGMSADVMLSLMQTESEQTLNKARIAFVLLRSVGFIDRVVNVTFNKKKMLFSPWRVN